MKKLKKTAMVTTNIRISPETLEKVKKTAETKKRSVTQMLRIIVEDYIEKLEL